MKKLLLAGAFALSSVVAIQHASAASVPESDDKITMMLGNWATINIQAQIAGQLLEDLGYTVEYVPVDDSARYPAFESGDVTFSMETWATSQKANFESSLATGKILDMGSISAHAKEEWWFPSYMKDKCPGLPDWTALKEPACAGAFSAPETAPKGRYLGAPADWGGHDEERVEALGLPFEVVHAGSDASLFAELKSAYERKAPILLWLWTPNWTESKFDGEFVKFPVYEDACYNDPKWGSNPDKAYDCGKPEGWIKKMAWKEGQTKWACAYDIITKYDMDAPSLALMAAEVDLDGKDTRDVAREWINKNGSTWEKWTACAK